MRRCEVTREPSPLLTLGLRWLENPTPSALEDLLFEAAFCASSPLANAIRECGMLPGPDRETKLRDLLSGYRALLTPLLPETCEAHDRLRMGLRDAW